MTNAEKYKDEIRAQERKTGNWAVDKNTGEIMNCLYCAKCLFCNDCYDTKIEWLVSEYKEQKEFTDEEQALIKLLDEVEWAARDYDGELFFYREKPKICTSNKGTYWETDDGFWIRAKRVTSLPFSAIKSTDTEPTNRAEILGEEK